MEKDGTRDPKNFPCSDQNYSPFSTVKNIALKQLLNGYMMGCCLWNKHSSVVSIPNNHLHSELVCFSFSLKRFGQKLQNRWNVLSRRGSFHHLKCKMENKIHGNISIARSLCLGSHLKAGHSVLVWMGDSPQRETSETKVQNLMTTHFMVL